MKALAFWVVAVFLFVVPVCCADAEGSQAVVFSHCELCFEIETPAASPSASSGLVQQVPPADQNSGEPGSGPPAGYPGSSLVSGLMATGVAAALIVAVFLIISIRKKSQ